VAEAARGHVPGRRKSVHGAFEPRHMTPRAHLEIWRHRHGRLERDMYLAAGGLDRWAGQDDLQSVVEWPSERRPIYHDCSQSEAAGIMVA
jgi:hypothetical protein